MSFLYATATGLGFSLDHRGPLEEHSDVHLRNPKDRGIRHVQLSSCTDILKAIHAMFTGLISHTQRILEYLLPDFAKKRDQLPVFTEECMLLGLREIPSEP